MIGDRIVNFAALGSGGMAISPADLSTSVREDTSKLVYQVGRHVNEAVKGHVPNTRWDSVDSLQVAPRTEWPLDCVCNESVD